MSRVAVDRLLATIVMVLCLGGCSNLFAGATQTICAPSDEGADSGAPEGCLSLSQSRDEAAGSGFARCADEIPRRTAALACVACFEVRTCPEFGGCADCAAPKFCAEGSLGSCFCYEPCFDDDDCGPSRACVCPSGGNASSPATGNINPQCVPAGCRTDEDCASDATCRLSSDICGAPGRLDCTTDSDLCSSSSQCDGGRCAFDAEAETFSCQGTAECG